MNKHFYRIIFNKARGIMMVVAEIVKRHQGEGRSSQKATSTTSRGKVTAALKPLSFLTFVALGMVSVVTQSQASTIITDNNAAQSQRPTIIERPNGPTVVNIQEANKAGVSHNKYNQFDVSKEGVILNNSAQSSNTQLGGNIAGNSNLANSGGAKVILNEINSANASQLNGKIEVAGQKAQVVIANAAGITCNGCGFINADRATLTTGSAIIGDDGTLQGYQVEQGNITINGEFDSREQDYTNLIARTVNINGQIQANRITVVAGKNNVYHAKDFYNDESLKVEKIYNNDDKPVLAIDVAALGGMYANKITLRSTETGVGVRNAGRLGAYGHREHIAISATGQITNTGKIYLEDYHEDTESQPEGNKKNIDSLATSLASSQAISINSKTTSYTDSEIRDEEDDYITFYDKAVPQYSIALRTNDRIVNEGDIDISNTDRYGWLLGLDGKKGIDNKGNIESRSKSGNRDSIELNSDQAIYNSGAIFTDGSVNTRSHDMYNTGKINALSMIHNGEDGRFVNAGDISYSKLGSDVGIYAHDFDNRGTIIAGSLADIEAINLNNSGKIKASDYLYLSTTELIDPEYDDMNNISPNEGVITNSGTLEAGKRLAIGVNTLENSGKISSGGELGIGQYLEIHDNPDPDSIYSIAIPAGKAQSVNNQSGTIEANGDLTIGAEQINNSGKIKSANNMNLALNMLNNTDGQIYSGGAINIGKDLNEDGTITGRATMVNNLSGSIEAADDITIDALYYLYSTD
ncbi:filamentous hemagglutinin N-terminal domain-containing protein [Orbus sturtevantii]|uniref:two-partner secretion domain-containing protein n=1 Tax=Orbus sturtevantii TaxID=3074109 RepID=UPI00370D4A64